MSMLDVMYGTDVELAKRQTDRLKAYQEQIEAMFNRRKAVDESNRRWTEALGQVYRHQTPSGGEVLREQGTIDRYYGPPSTEGFMDAKVKMELARRKEAFLGGMFGMRTANPYKGAGERLYRTVFDLQRGEPPDPAWSGRFRVQREEWSALAESLGAAAAQAREVGRRGGSVVDLRQSIKEGLPGVSDLVLDRLTGMVLDAYYEAWYNTQSPTSPFYQGGATPPEPSQFIGRYLEEGY